MTHLENIPHILLHGITHRQSQNSNKIYKPIGDSSLIRTRDTFEIFNGKMIGDYTPFYFGPRSPMLYVIQNGYNGIQSISPEKIVYCVSNLQMILDSNLSFIYTDGHATDGFTKKFSSNDITNITSQVDLKATMATYWKDEQDLDLKRRKEAEFLIEGDLATEYIKAFVVYNESSKRILLKLGVDENIIVIKPNFYF